MNATMANIEAKATMATLADSEAQISSMTQFILNEAKDKAEEISAKALQEFNVEKLKVVNATKEKIRQGYDRKSKQVDTQNAIARSTAINRSRLEKIKARQDMIGKISTESKEAVAKELQNKGRQNEFI